MGDTGSAMAFGMLLVVVFWVVLGLVLGLSFMGLRRWVKRRGYGAWGAVFGLLAFGSWILWERAFWHFFQFSADEAINTTNRPTLSSVSTNSSLFLPYLVWPHSPRLAIRVWKSSTVSPGLASANVTAIAGSPKLELEWRIPDGRVA